MKARLTLIAAFLFVLVAAAAVLLGGSVSEGVKAQRPEAASASAAPRQSGYCQQYGCIDMPQSGYCPSGYYRFWSTWCCCPINRQSQPAGPTAALASAAQTPAPPDTSDSFLYAPLEFGRGRCGRS
ncbi:MAG TPA: hypothetical protein VG148_07610 [Pyrinomonadaceae bacterium]|nr:hypothetical protein [Pyrinomonadaceae bacterium]